VARFLKHSLAATEPRYLALRRLGLMVSQAVFAAIALACGVALLASAPVLAWLSFGLAAASVVGIAGLWSGSEWARRLCLAVNLALVAGQVAVLLSQLVQGTFALTPGASAVLLFVAAQAYLFADPDTKHVLARVRERRGERTAAAH
jgi:hypothetical protein